MLNFNYRSLLIQPNPRDSMPVNEFTHYLQKQAQLNQWTNSYRPILQFIEQIWKQQQLKGLPLRILDVGFGYGDLLRKIALFAQKKGIEVLLYGIDSNPLCMEAAEAASAHFKINYRTLSAFELGHEEYYDVIIGSLMTHHLDPLRLRDLLIWFERHATGGWMVFDAHRHPLPYYFSKIFLKAIRFHPSIAQDLPLTIARAFTGKDWKNLIDETGMNNEQISVRWHWPFRYSVSHITQSAKTEPVLSFDLQ